MEALIREKGQYSIGKASFVFLVAIEILDSIICVTIVLLPVYASHVWLNLPCLGPCMGPLEIENHHSFSETKNEGMLEYFFIINDGQDIEETIVTYLQNSINSSENVNGCKLMGFILSACGSVLDTKNEGSYAIASLGGRYIISEDGQVQQRGPLTISCADASCAVVFGGEVAGPLVAVGDVQVVIATFAYDASEDEV